VRQLIVEMAHADVAGEQKIAETKHPKQDAYKPKNIEKRKNEPEQRTKGE